MIEDSGIVFEILKPLVVLYILFPFSTALPIRLPVITFNALSIVFEENVIASITPTFPIAIAV